MERLVCGRAMLRYFVVLTITSLLWMVRTMAQMPAGSSSLSGGSLVGMLRDAPVTVEQVEERASKLPNGSSRTEIVESKIYRDYAGRFRIETKAPAPLSETVLLADPVEGYVALLVPSAKIAHRMMQPKTNPSSGIGFAWAGIQMRGKDRKKEDIEKLTIEGIDFEGIRMTVTSDDQPAVVTVDERWMSKELALTGRVEATSPTEHYSARIKTVIREDPDPALFIIPADYTIRDLEEGRDHPLR
jgi:hypothetical protein